MWVRYRMQFDSVESVMDFIQIRECKPNKIEYTSKYSRYRYLIEFKF